MDRRLIVRFAKLFAVCVVAISATCLAQRAGGPSYAEPRTGRTEDNVGTNSFRTMILGTSAHYPHLPQEVVSAHLGVRLPLLSDAKDRQEIVGWADSHSLTRGSRIHSLLSLRPQAEWLLLMHIWTSGRQAWNVYLYGYRPFKAGDPRPWKLLYVGGDRLDTKGINDIECVYIDASKRALFSATGPERSWEPYQLPPN